MSSIPCPCGRRAVLVSGEQVYPNLHHLHDRRFFKCECGSWVGVHRGSDKPLGTPADQETRRARMAAHEAFDPLWRCGARRPRFTRHEAYRWLARRLGISRDDCHIGNLDAEQCAEVVRLVQELVKV